MGDLLTRCKWPELPEKYALALRQAVELSLNDTPYPALLLLVRLFEAILIKPAIWIST